MRQRGSSRFDPYYKVQCFDERSMTWRDVQKAHPSEAEARAAMPSGQRCRVMAVTMAGRRPL